MTFPGMPDPLAPLLEARDSSVPLGMAALVGAADETGRATFGALAVAYRAAFLRLRAEAKGISLPEAGTLSVDDARANLADSVLPRLALDHLVTFPNQGTERHDDDAIIVAPELWTVLRADREGTARRLLVAAAAAIGAAEAPGVAAHVKGGHRISSRGLVKAYKGRRVVDDVSITLEQGEIVGLLGPNGAGKTTTFYMITGLIRPEAGRIFLDDRDITQEPMFRRARAGLGYLAQEPSVFRKLSVEENVLAILETLPLDARAREARCDTLLDELGIKHLRKQKAYQLSGGERRRLEITRALVTEPKFLLLDEPFAGVDPIAVNDIQTIVAGLRRKGIGVLITDHNVEQTLDIVDRAYIMFEGKVQVNGTVRELVYDDRVADRYLGPTLTARLRGRLGAGAVA
ncbi:MAG TPA: LPS export ABC transporter ATP-binding protein [Gemmatimonadales bacterium]|nr:LPS export ABC transporter ATP-binding protein [Gemmatimonadales bacterium]